MPRSSDPHQGHTLKLSLLVLVILAPLLGGCYQEREPPRQFVPGNPLYEQFTTQGSRLTIADGNGQRILKARRQARSLKAYDATHRPLGRVRWTDEQTVRVHQFNDSRRAEVSWIDESTAALEGSWRMEQIDRDRWDLWDSEDRLVGLWHRSEDGQWSLFKTTEDDPILSAQADDRKVIIVDDDGVEHLTIAGRTFGEAASLAMTVEYLEPLPRWSLAVWCALHLDGEDHH